MLNIQKRGLDQLLGVLTSLNAEYKIILPDGTEYGTLEVAPKKSQHRQAPIYGRNVLINHFRPWIGNLEPGHSATVPVGEFDAKILNRAIGSWIARVWGTPNAMHAIEKDELGEDIIEVLRLS